MAEVIAERGEDYLFADSLISVDDFLTRLRIDVTVPDFRHSKALANSSQQVCDATVYSQSRFFQTISAACSPLLLSHLLTIVRLIFTFS